MENLDKTIINLFEDLIREGKEIRDAVDSLDNGEYLDKQYTTRAISWTSRTVNLLEKVCPENSIYLTFIDYYPDDVKYLTNRNVDIMNSFLGSLDGACNDYKVGLLSDIRNFLRAEIFTDFLEMGEYLLNEGYKDAAAVIIGSVLEDTLRKLAIEKNIEILNSNGKPKTMEPLNQDLKKANVYNEFTRKQVTTWADLRNNAAHGHYDEYNIKEVKTMLYFVQSFCSDYLS
jgi:hypothetical protein